ncbi:PREDICTED: KH homology domain-containing protein 1B-like [Elephantulus edwardii]|uniref:KH homology domain-containing protein 1B-like n=1 Tax=Elephantulus edwardii TaxID=28737 RepID=UPI0003F0B2AC|nr:PREDICTED: KH homology domain-containing protein 1B-like [Elephantulus edwardii]
MSREKVLSKKPWWSVPENLVQPLEFCMYEETEEQIFGTGPSDTLLHRTEGHSGSLIHLERWFQPQVVLVVDAREI